MHALADERVAFPGRFQPLHRGHYRVVRAYRELAGSFVLALGSPEEARTAENPLSAAERERIVRGCFPDLEIVRVPDVGRGEAGYPLWGRRLVARTDADVVLTGNPRVQRIVREYTDARVREQEMHYPDRFSGTELRERIRADESWRPLVPACARERVADYAGVIARTGDAGE
ncbi:nicotinamide-nucleotide adenylyltransferase, NadM family [Halarchaeum acidiphilum MH1-52-1]|uniref:Nicotinamide-nucleotide adenylyltransferase, NadM family n=1 Tax=Halarchaeum acidiphilum MH1-52-1 TaxID=1261545 RepID=U2YXP9_9EURY|nr:adenylyltransferase/cytidyltransferase family protein [Halarchaeum acidiphilum]GAD53587.1 nicotinamide-nucleotide adenylyltransferase, NadM family [Halarchaeum acidiphilum MH1-52-1]